MASNRKFIKCGLHNMQSVCNKTDEVRELINELSLDIFVHCETWLVADEKTNKTIINKMCPSTHSFHHVPRPREDTLGRGGVGIFLSKAFTHIKMRCAGTHSTFEHLIIDFNYNREKLKFIVVYKPPKSSESPFREQLQDLLDTMVDETRKVYICGDFNQWVEDPNSRNAVLFLELMDSFNFTNNVNTPTSRRGHTLDLVFSDKDMCNTRNVQVEPDSLYYHHLVTFELDLMTNRKTKKKITFRNKANLQPDLLISKAVDTQCRRKHEPCECKQDGSQKAACCNCLTDIYNHTLRSLYEDMCPMVDKEISVTDHEPWFNSTIKEARKKRRWFEKDWRKKRTTQARELYTRSRNEVNRLIRKRKEDYFRSKVREGKGDNKKLSTLFNDLLGKTKEKALPEYTPGLAQNFADFFEEKIDNIYNSFDNHNTRGGTFLPELSLRKFSNLEPISWESYKNLVKSSKKSYCESDPLPMGDIMCATNVDELLKLQHDIINNSLVMGVFPNSEKTALIKPTLKNNLDPQILSSYRPVSNLTN
ncbi:MAG: endonuclease/exonuclease/phosphatase family protein, partial [Cyanobacteria bacterium J06553_1]